MYKMQFVIEIITDEELSENELNNIHDALFDVFKYDGFPCFVDNGNTNVPLNGEELKKWLTESGYDENVFENEGSA
jgi:hypothetical protein